MWRIRRAANISMGLPNVAVQTGVVIQTGAVSTVPAVAVPNIRRLSREKQQLMDYPVRENVNVTDGINSYSYMRHFSEEGYNYVDLRLLYD